MKIALSYDSKTIKQLIAKDIRRKLGVDVPVEMLEILVRSKQNYRVHDFERGEFKCDLEVDI